MYEKLTERPYCLEMFQSEGIVESPLIYPSISNHSVSALASTCVHSTSSLSVWTFLFGTSIDRGK